MPDGFAQLARRTDRVSTPLTTDVLQVQYGDPLGDGWTTARIVSVIVPILLTVSVLAYFAYLWIARRDLVKAERERIDAKWNGSGGTIYVRKGGRRPAPTSKPEMMDDDDGEDLYAPGYRPRDTHSLASGHAYGGGSSADSHTLQGSPEPSKFVDSPQLPGRNLRAAESTYTLTDPQEHRHHHQQQQQPLPPMRQSDRR